MTYWQRRQKEQLKALEKSEKALMQRLTEYYRDEYAKLDKEIASFYSKYGVKKIIEYRMLLQELCRRQMVRRQRLFAENMGKHRQTRKVSDNRLGTGLCKRRVLRKTNNANRKTVYRCCKKRYLPPCLYRGYIHNGREQCKAV